MDIYLTSYDQKYNLGDVIQTIALSRKFMAAKAMPRHKIHKEEGMYVVNGYHDVPYENPGEWPLSLFAGVFASKERLGQGWFRSSPLPLGARDPHTLMMARELGISVEMVGDATLTMEPWEGERFGVYAVDMPDMFNAHEKGAIPISHALPKHYRFSRAWQKSMDVLELYRRANAVYTTRLHCALPCLAFGTPVWITTGKKITNQPERFTLLDELGVKQNGWANEDGPMDSVKEMGALYLEFLKKYCSEYQGGVQPRMPT